MRERIAMWAERFIRRVEGFLEEPPRCPWETPLGTDQCCKSVNHRGSCRTVTRFGESRYWYGINWPKDFDVRKPEER